MRDRQVYYLDAGRTGIHSLPNSHVKGGVVYATFGRAKKQLIKEVQRNIQSLKYQMEYAKKKLTAIRKQRKELERWVYQNESRTTLVKS